MNCAAPALIDKSVTLRGAPPLIPSCIHHNPAIGCLSRLEIYFPSFSLGFHPISHSLWTEKADLSMSDDEDFMQESDEEQYAPWH